jgi:DNA-binding transcriptional LysR family regulator
MYDLPPTLRRLRMEHPRIDLMITNMPTRDAVEAVVQNSIDLALVTLPVKSSSVLRVTPLQPQLCVAIFPAAMPDIPAVVTPQYLARQPLVLEHDRGAVHALVMQWLARHLPLARQPMHVGIVEAAKQAVASGLGISIVPDVSVAAPIPEIVVRPLKPSLPCTLGLVERKSKAGGLAIETVRNALLGLRSMREPAPIARTAQLVGGD